MRVCIVGAGAIGGFLAARLTRGGAEVTLVARGATLQALRATGLTLIEADGSARVHRIRAVASLPEAGVQDIVVLATKAHQVDAIVDTLPSTFDRRTVLVPMQNGIPFWYFQKLDGEHAGRAVRSVDPEAKALTGIPAERIVGCVVYPACDADAPAVIRHVEGERFPVGELDGTTTDRVTAVSDLFTASGLKSPVLADIRSEIWLKLWGNLCLNPISALTGATLAAICAEPHTRALAAAMMEEAHAVATRLGASFRVGIDRRLEGAAKVGEHRTSMLQDIDARRRTEIDALLGSVIELAKLTGTAVPRLEAVYACMRLLERTVCDVALPELAAARSARPPQGKLEIPPALIAVPPGTACAHL
jgi:2-dehydropantoate 2-reductase